MSNKGKTFAGTIRSLEDLRSRCVINDETGCWVFRSGEKYGAPRAYFTHPGTGDKLVWTATKVAWIMAGNPEPAKGVKVYRYQCMAECCVNPDHLRAGTSKQIGACITRHGKHIGRPERIAVNTRNARKRSSLTPEIVREIRASNEGNTELGRRMGIPHNIVSQVRHGRSWQDVAAPNSSVFSWRPAA